MTYVGIDPGEHTGLAVWDTEKKAFVSIRTLPLWAAMEAVAALASEGPVTVVCEDARLRKWFPREHSLSEYRGRLMGAGAAKRDAAAWEEFLRDKGIPYVMRKPQAHGTKWPAQDFARVTGYTGRTSEHGRDAALLVFGR